MQEIERKFLVLSDDYKKQATAQFAIAQGYLNTHPDRTVRVRIKGEKAFLTIKGIGNQSGTTRFEWEKEIEVNEARELLALCEEGMIDKIRYEVPLDEFTYEVDEFKGDNEGLVIAEIELSDEHQKFPKPEWLGQEVTGKNEYYNAYLNKKPFKKW
jgi:adenylate cyclase